MLFDTGVLYRAVTLLALRAGVPPDAGARLAELAAGLGSRIAVARPSLADGRLYDVRLDGEDATWALRDDAVEARVSQVAAQREVRAALLPVQREIAAGNPVVMVGRDVGTVVVPDAGVKVFLAAGPEERARRRHAELLARGEAVTLADVLADLRTRDAIDSGREVAPLRAASDAVVVHTDRKSVAEVVGEVEQVVRAAWSRSNAGAGAGGTTAEHR